MAGLSLSPRLQGWLSTFLLVLGALLFGDAIHGAVTTSQFALTSPAAVLRFLFGTALMVVGYRLQTPIGEYVDTASERPEPGQEEAAEGGEFQPDLSPVGEMGERDSRSGSGDQEGDGSGEESPGSSPVRDGES